MPYKPPEHEETSFNCVHCSTLARHYWKVLHYLSLQGGGYTKRENLKIAICEHCKKFSIWYEGDMVYPDVSTAPKPNKDLPDEVKDDYLEASSIMSKSPRGAAALLRLCIQKLCKFLGEKGKNINNDIANLVEKGLPVKIQKSLDFVRVIGNNSVHPGQIDMKDDVETASKLFDLINIIADVMITQPKEIDKLYDTLPDTSRDAISKRDGKKS